MYTKSITLQKEIQKLNNHLQAADEVDGYFYSVHKLLMNFNEQDWEGLKADLRKWEDKELRTLALALKDGDGFGNVIDDNYFYGYIFSIVDIEYANWLIDGLLFFFEKNETVSIELLEAIKTKIEALKINGYIHDTYDFWITSIEDFKRKAGS